jgi:hypothetical protein
LFVVFAAAGASDAWLWVANTCICPSLLKPSTLQEAPVHAPQLFNQATACSSSSSTNKCRLDIAAGIILAAALPLADLVLYVVCQQLLLCSRNIHAIEYAPLSCTAVCSWLFAYGYWQCVLV